MGSGVEPLAIATKSSKRGSQMSEGQESGIRRNQPIPDTCLHVMSVESVATLAAARETGRRHALRRDGLDQADREISTGKLHALLRFHTRPINVVVYHGSQARPRFEAGFPLRCFQRLSLPYLATRLCRWRDNRSTRGTSIPVLSY